MRVYITIILYSILLLLYPIKLSADNYQFKQLSIAEGFPAAIQTIYAETNGLVWIGTKSGLSLFNGYTLKNYTHTPEDSTSLPGNEIYQIIEDSMHQIWVLTNKGVALYNKSKNTFQTIRDEQNKKLLATAACLSSKGLLFFTKNGIYNYNYSNRTVLSFVKFKQPSTYIIHEIWEWDANHLLCVNKWEGTSILNLKTGLFSPSPFEEGHEITRVLIDKQKRIWTTSYNRGIICYNHKGEKIASYNTSNSKLSHDIILCLNEHQGKIWAGTDGGGINIIDPEKQSINTLLHEPGDKNSLPVNSIQCLYQDENSDYCWAGSIKGGLINICRTFMRTYSDVPLTTSNGLSERAVLAFYQEPNSKDIWIGTDGGGINKFNPETQSFTHFPKTWGEKIVSISGYNNQELLVSLFSKGIYTFNKTTGILKKINNGNPIINKYALYGRKAINLYQDNPYSILILSSEIYRYYFDNERIQQLSDKDIEIQRQVIPISHDSIHTYLYDSKHIYSINQTNNKIEILHTASSDQIYYSISKDEDDIFWIGSSKGLSYYNPKTEQEIPIENSLLKDVISVICDNNNHVWIGSNNRLLMWISDKKKLIAFDESDGAIANEFLDKAVLFSKEGDIYMGGINGMLHINQKAFKEKPVSSSSFSLTDILCNNQSLLTSVDFDNNIINLANEDRNVTIRVMVHENNIFRNKIFKWYIHGADVQIIESNTPEITLHSLTPGSYRIEVSCNTKDGQWTNKASIITLNIPPAWYQTWWFTSICIVLISGIIIFIILYLLHRKEEHMISAIKEHKQKIYEEKVRFLININHELRTPLTLIHTPLKYLLNNLSPNNDIYPTLQSMLKQSVRMKDLLNMVLNLRRMEMTQEKLHIGTYQLNKWIQEIGNDFTYEEKERNITLKYELDNRIDWVDFDKEKHIIILTNLIINALKHSQKDSSVTLKTELLSNKEKVRISVSDQGCGLYDIDINKLFTRFYQGENEKEGSGIGLSYAKILVEQHHGSINACNNPDKGACFFYDLPLHQNKENPSNPPQEYLNTLMQSDDIDACIPLNNNINTHNYSCLFVDDNNDMRSLISSILEKEFKHLYIASNGKEALQIAREEIPDIIVSDIMMPQMNGYELCRAIKEDMNINYIQVILLTARIDEQSHIDGYKIGADAYLEKPFEIETLLATITNRLFLREQFRRKYATTLTPDITEIITTSADDTFINKLNELIEKHMDDENLNITYLCKEVGLSRASLYNKLKALTDLSPNEYINKARMERAMLLLKQTDLNITEIAEKTGFSSSRYFSTAFKKYTGMTPSQYKEENMPPKSR